MLYFTDTESYLIEFNEARRKIWRYSAHVNLLCLVEWLQ